MVRQIDAPSIRAFAIEPWRPIDATAQALDGHAEEVYLIKLMVKARDRAFRKKDNSKALLDGSKKTWVLYYSTNTTTVAGQNEVFPISGIAQRTST